MSVTPLQAMAESLSQVMELQNNVADAVDGQPVVAGREVFECPGGHAVDTP